MKALALLILSLVASISFAQNQDLSCNNPQQYAKAEKAKVWVSHKLSEINSKAIAIGITHCNGYWAEKALGRVTPQHMTLPQCGVGIGFEDEESLLHAARSLGSFIEIEGGHQVRICGKVIGTVKAL